MITVKQHRISVVAFQATQYEGEIANYAIESYGYVLKQHPFGQSAHYTFSEFADLIEKHYDTAEPRNAEVVAILRSIHQRNATLH